MVKEPSIFYFLETEIHSTRKRRTLTSGERACNQLKWVSKFEVWPSPLGICVASRLFCPLHCRAFGIKRLSPRGESLVEFYIFSAFQWESLLYYRVWQIFMRYFCNCGLEFWYCGISKHAESSVIGSTIFSMDVSNCSVFLCGFTVFGKPLAALQSFFFCACVYYCYKTGFDSVIPCPVAV